MRGQIQILGGGGEEGSHSKYRESQLLGGGWQIIPGRRGVRYPPPPILDSYDVQWPIMILIIADKIEKILSTVDSTTLGIYG